mgnify:CR=1 FL=1
MSADPITLITIGKTLLDIKDSRDQAKIQAEQYAAKREAARIRALEDEAERKKQWKLQEAHNLAIQASGGFSIDSRSFLNIQDQGENLMKKDIATIRVNLAQDVNQLSLAAQMAKKTRKKEQFGGWLSIGSTWYESKNKDKV